jgi:hypothetical protein
MGDEIVGKLLNAIRAVEKGLLRDYGESQVARGEIPIVNQLHSLRGMYRPFRDSAEATFATRKKTDGSRTSTRRRRASPASAGCAADKFKRVFDINAEAGIGRALRRAFAQTVRRGDGVRRAVRGAARPRLVRRDHGDEHGEPSDGLEPSTTSLLPRVPARAQPDVPVSYPRRVVCLQNKQQSTVRDGS